MTNPTSNYGFVLPTSSDLVTDLPADFDVALQGVDTRLKALQPGTTLGDLAYSSATANTNTRLGIGTTGQVLSVSAGVPAWSTPASGGSLTQLATGTFSGSAVNLTSISGAYKDLRLVVQGLIFSSVTELRFRVNSLSTTIYTGVLTGTVFQDPNATSAETMRNNTTNTESYGIFTIPSYTGSTNKQMQTWTFGRGTSGGNPIDVSIVGYNNIKTSAAITEINMFPNSGTFSGGTYTLFGVN